MATSDDLRQPSRWEPLLPALVDRVDALGVIGLRCRVVLLLQVESGRPLVPVSFVVDSGASYSLMSLELARLRRLPLPPPESEVEFSMRTARGSSLIRVRPGRIRAWWGEDPRGYPFDWPVLFRVDAPLDVPSILGLGGVVKTCRWDFDGRSAPDAPYGYLVLDDTR